MEFKSFIGYDFGQPETLFGGGQVQAADDSPPIAETKTYWSGRVFFGGALVYGINSSQLAAFKNTHVKVNLRTGAVTGEDWDETSTSGLNEYEYYSVKTKTKDEDGNDVYTLNNHTVGDIRCRIT